MSVFRLSGGRAERRALILHLLGGVPAPPPSVTPNLDFSSPEPTNSQYLAILEEAS